MSELLGGRHVVLVSSGTTASLVAFHILRKQGYSSLLMPDFCFPSVASSAIRTGLRVMLADIEPDRLNLDLRQAESVATSRETVVLTVDQFGIPGFNQDTAQLAKQKGWAWFEDAACALGSHENSVPCGTEATVAILSFHPRKILTTGEGGALVTASEELAQEARLLRSLGVSGQGANRRFEQLGYNARLSELHAAVGLAQAEILAENLAIRRRLGCHFLELLEPLEQVTVPAGFRDSGANFQSLVVLLDPAVSRNRVIASMRGAGVECTIPGFAIHRQDVFQDLVRLGPLVVSSAVHDRGLALPLHERMSEEQVGTVVDTLAKALSNCVQE